LPSDDLLERWLAAALATPGITALEDLASARAHLLDDALRALPLVQATDGDVVDVGSGTGSPGLPLAAALPGRKVWLLDGERRKCEFLAGFANELPNVEVVWDRAEQHQRRDYGVALAKALAKPAVAAELILPLVREGGTAILWCGESADTGAIARVAEQLAAELQADEDGLFVLRKGGPTPAGFPRKPGMAKKRPLG
jgi:16S rRNA (guanine527-N7)-methyltransferase